MHRKKVIVVDEKLEHALTLLCEIAMKFSGMHMATIVADVANALRDEQHDLYDEFKDEDW
jgi:hypothetical protein